MPHISYDKGDSHLQTSNATLSEAKDQSYEDTMSPTFANSTLQVPNSPPSHKSMDVPSTILEFEPPTDNNELSQDTHITASASEDVPPTPAVPPSPKPQPYEPEVTPPHDDAPSEQVHDEHAVDIESQAKVIAEPALVANGDLNPPSSVTTVERSPNADSPSIGGGDHGLSQENGPMEREVAAPVTNENSVVVADANQNGHAECDDELQLDATVAEPAEESPVDTNPASIPDKVNACTNETIVNPPDLSTERLSPNEPGGTEKEKGPPEDATVAHGDAVVWEGVQANGHVSANCGHTGENPADSQVPLDATPTSMPNETVDHSETHATPPCQPGPVEGLDETPTVVSIVDRAKEESVEDPLQGTAGAQETTVLSPSVETAEGATYQPVEPVVETTGHPPASDPTCATVDKGSEPVIPPHDQAEVKEQPEGDAITADESKEEALSAAVDVENSAQGPGLERGQALPGQQEEGTICTTPVPDTTSVEPAEDIPAQSAELFSTASDSQSNIEDPVDPPLPPPDRPEAAYHPQGSHLGGTKAVASARAGITTASLPANDKLNLAEDSISAPPEEPIADVQAETEEGKLEDIHMESGGDLTAPASNTEPAQGEVNQEKAVELTKEGTYRSFCFVLPNA